MNAGLVVGGIVLLIFGAIFVLDGAAIMDASQSDSFLGFTYTDEESYNYGLGYLMVGIIFVIIGLVMLVAGATMGGSEKPQPQTVAPPPHQQPQYPQQQVPYQQPPYQAPQPAPMPIMPPVHQPPAQPQVQPKFCGACGFKNTTVAKFCNNCGESLETKVEIPPEPVREEPVKEEPAPPEAEEEFIFCEECGHQNTADSKFCKSCGEAVKDHPME